jgi:regulatory protein
VKITLSDGSFFFTHRDIQIQRGIEEGRRFSPDELLSAQAETQRVEAEKKALRLLATSPHSKQNLRLKLIKRGFGSEAVQHALGRMEEMGYLDDAEYAEQWIRSRIRRHPEGKQSLVAGLMKRGVERSVAVETADRIVTTEVESRCALRFARKIGGREPGRLQKKLLARGFAFSVVRSVLRELDEAEAAEPD